MKIVCIPWAYVLLLTGVLLACLLPILTRKLLGEKYSPGDLQ